MLIDEPMTCHTRRRVELALLYIELGYTLNCHRLETNYPNCSEADWSFDFHLNDLVSDLGWRLNNVTTSQWDWDVIWGLDPGYDTPPMLRIGRLSGLSLLEEALAS